MGLLDLFEKFFGMKMKIFRGKKFLPASKNCRWETNVSAINKGITEFILYPLYPY